MGDTVTIPRTEYDRLRAAEDDLVDLQAALAVRERIDAGTEELVPAAVADRLIGGAGPLKACRSSRPSYPYRALGAGVPRPP